MKARQIVTSVFFLTISTYASAEPIAFGFEWQSDNEYSLDGTFSFDDSLLGSGVITQADLLSFSMAGYLNGTLLGTFDGIPESLFFDTNELFFPVGVNDDGSFNFQAWNFIGDSGIGFLSARFSQSLLLDGEFIDGAGFRVDALTREDSRLTVFSVPEPGTLALLGLGLLGLSIARRVQA